MDSWPTRNNLPIGDNNVQGSPAQGSQGQTEQNETASLSTVYRKQLISSKLDENPKLNMLDAENFAKFEVAAKVYERESRKNKLLFWIFCKLRLRAISDMPLMCNLFEFDNSWQNPLLTVISYQIYCICSAF